MLPPVMIPAGKRASQYLSWSRALGKACQQAAKGVSLNLTALCGVLFNLKFASCAYKVTVAIDSVGNIV